MSDSYGGWRLLFPRPFSTYRPAVAALPEVVVQRHAQIHGPGCDFHPCAIECEDQRACCHPHRTAPESADRTQAPPTSRKVWEPDGLSTDDSPTVPISTGLVVACSLATAAAAPKLIAASEGLSSSASHPTMPPAKRKDRCRAARWYYNLPSIGTFKISHQ